MAFSQTSRHLSGEEEFVSIGPEISSLGSNAKAFSRNFEARAVSPDASTHRERALNASARNGFAPLLAFAALAAKVKIDRSSIASTKCRVAPLRWPKTLYAMPNAR